MSIKNYGFKIDASPDLNAYVYGGLVALPKITLREDGQWDDYLPTTEQQANPNFDSYGCTVFGTENVVEILLKYIYGQDKNFSERYIYNLAEITPPGADPHQVAETIRSEGLIDQDLLPMVETYEEFASPRPMESKYQVIGTQFPYELKHEYVFKNRDSKETKISKMKECLKYSPLGMSVTGWEEENGVYVDKGEPNTHWTCCYGWNDKGWKVFDSYDPFLKIVSFDHNIERCKRYLLVDKPPRKVWWLDLLYRLLGR